MKVSFTEDFIFQLKEQSEYIAKDKPIAARKFKNDLLKKIRKDLINPFHFKKSIYFENEIYRDYVFKGYTITVRIDSEKEIVYIIGILKHKKIF